MTPDRFRECLASLPLSPRDLADQLRCDERLVRRWSSGHTPMPPEIAAWIEAVMQVWAAKPPKRAAWFGREDLASELN